MTLNTRINPPRFFRSMNTTFNDAVTNEVLPADVDYNYGVNSFDRPAGYEGPFARVYLSMASISSPASVVGIADSRRSSPFTINGGDAASGGGSVKWEDVDNQADGRRHVGNTGNKDTNAMNVMFMDGHSKFINTRQSMKPNIWSCRDDD
jgi:prepilin-type processing-associated H-X9-DG protein